MIYFMDSDISDFSVSEMTYSYYTAGGDDVSTRSKP